PSDRECRPGAFRMRQFARLFPSDRLLRRLRPRASALLPPQFALHQRIRRPKHLVDCSGISPSYFEPDYSIESLMPEKRGKLKLVTEHEAEGRAREIFDEVRHELRVP